MTPALIGFFALVAIILAIVNACGKCGPCLAIAVIILALTPLAVHVPKVLGG